ncbi:MAG: NAD(P)-dependent oxidoreductase [Candidatus Omnitrophota bacterium]
MNVLIIGASGLTGRYLCENFSKGHNVAGTFCKDQVPGLLYMNLTDSGTITEVFKRFRPELVLMPASATNVDFCEKDHDTAWNINVEGTKLVAVCCRKAGAFLTYYSTDYVFDGAKGPYSEDDATGPISFYGRTKLEAEKAVQKELEHYLIIRPCGIYGYHHDVRNFVLVTINRLRKKEEVPACVDQFYTPTYAGDLSNNTRRLIEGKKAGVYHMAGADWVNRQELCLEIARTFGMDERLVKGVMLSELGLPAERPKKSGLKTDKIRHELGIEPVSLKDGLAMMKNRMIKEGVL